MSLPNISYLKFPHNSENQTFSVDLWTIYEITLASARLKSVGEIAECSQKYYLITVATQDFIG